MKRILIIISVILLFFSFSVSAYATDSDFEEIWNSTDEQTKEYLEDLGIVITQDSLVEDVHFNLEYTTPYQLGYKSIMVNISDICASGGEPKYVTIALSLPKDIQIDFIKEFYELPSPTKNVKDMKEYATRMCTFLFDNKEITKLFIKNNTDNDFTLLFQNFADNFLTSKTIQYKNRTVDEHTVKLMTTFFAYGIYSLIKQWLMEEIPKTPVELADLIIGSLNKDFSFI